MPTWISGLAEDLLSLSYFWLLILFGRLKLDSATSVVERRTKTSSYNTPLISMYPYAGKDNAHE